MMWRVTISAYATYTVGGRVWPSWFGDLPLMIWEDLYATTPPCYFIDWDYISSSRCWKYFFFIKTQRSTL